MMYLDSYIPNKLWFRIISAISQLSVLYIEQNLSLKIVLHIMVLYYSMYTIGLYIVASFPNFCHQLKYSFFAFIDNIACFQPAYHRQEVVSLYCIYICSPNRVNKVFTSYTSSILLILFTPACNTFIESRKRPQALL